MLTLYWRLRVWLNPVWLLDPACPMWFIDDELRRAGLDPDEIAERGAELARRLLEEEQP